MFLLYDVKTLAFQFTFKAGTAVGTGEIEVRVF